jgi:hypothetical protein
MLTPVVKHTREEGMNASNRESAVAERETAILMHAVYAEKCAANAALAEMQCESCVERMWREEAAWNSAKAFEIASAA